VIIIILMLVSFCCSFNLLGLLNDHTGPSALLVQVDDVMLAIDGKSVAQDGTVSLSQDRAGAKKRPPVFPFEIIF
jgi:hypothetical protein